MADSETKTVTETTSESSQTMAATAQNEQAVENVAPAAPAKEKEEGTVSKLVKTASAPGNPLEQNMYKVRPNPLLLHLAKPA